MALIKCPECSAEVSDKAYDCPRCGAPLRKPKRTLFGRFVKWFFIAFNILVVLAVAANIAQYEKNKELENMTNILGQAHGKVPTNITEENIIALLIFWFVGACFFGILLYFTRPSKNS